MHPGCAIICAKPADVSVQARHHIFKHAASAIQAIHPGAEQKTCIEQLVKQGQLAQALGKQSFCTHGNVLGLFKGWDEM
jgi:hypothetical protein